MSPGACVRCSGQPVTHKTTASGSPLCGDCAGDARRMFGPASVERLDDSTP